MDTQTDIAELFMILCVLTLSTTMYYRIDSLIHPRIDSSKLLRGRLQTDIELHGRRFGAQPELQLVDGKLTTVPSTAAQSTFGDAVPI